VFLVEVGASVQRSRLCALNGNWFVNIEARVQQVDEPFDLILVNKAHAALIKVDVIFLRSLNAVPLMIAGKMPALMKFLIRTVTMSPRSASSTSSCASPSSILTGTGGATSPLAVISTTMMLPDSTTSSSNQAMMCRPAPTLRNEQGWAQWVMMVSQGTWILVGDGGLARDDQYVRQS
jgi:hypothetical protein